MPAWPKTRDGYNNERTMATIQSPAVRPFTNEPLADYRNPENARGMREAIAKVRTGLGREYDLEIGGKPITTARKSQSINSAMTAEVVGIHQKAGREHLGPATRTAQAAVPT